MKTIPSINVALKKQSISVAVKLTVAVFILLSVALFYSRYQQKLDIVKEKVAIDQEFLIRSLKIGDHFFITKYISSLVEARAVVAAGLKGSNSDNWLFFSSQQGEDGKAFVEQYSLDWYSTQIPVRLELSGGEYEKWFLDYKVEIGHSFLLLPFFVSIFLCFIVFLFLRKTLATTSRYFSDPIASLATDMINHKATATLDLSTLEYDKSEKFQETDLLVNELKSLLSVIGQQQDRLKRTEVLEAISKLSHQVAHDVRSPLGALQAGISQLQDKPVEASSLIEKAAKRIQSIIEDLNTKESVNARESRDFEKVEINQFLSDLIVEKENELKQNFDREIQLHWQPLDSPRVLKILKSDLQRALSNILNNGFESVEEGVAVIKVKLLSEEKSLKIIISDNGKGISEKALGKVVDYGFTHGKIDGTGSGLAFAKDVVSKHNGSLDIQSKLNLGTTIEICLPT